MGCYFSTPIDNSPSSPDEPRGFVYVYNLHPKITVSQLAKKFEVFGKVTRDEIRLIKRGKTTGYAYIEFERKSFATKAIQAEYVVIRGRRVSIEETVRPPTINN